MGKILKITLVLILIFVFLKFFGGVVDRGLYQLIHKEKLIEAPKDKINCLKKGGTWGRWGLSRNDYCQIPFKVGGNYCVTGFMCASGRCIRRYNFGRSIPLGAGVCTKYPQAYGCTEELHFGVAGMGICRD